jgi:sorbitol-specific phosphotransferase system component IIBC
MRETRLTLPELALVAATRGLLGFGLGLLLADRLPPDQRRAVGWTLVAIGVLTTFPLAADVLGKSSPLALPAARAVP